MRDLVESNVREYRNENYVSQGQCHPENLSGFEQGHGVLVICVISTVGILHKYLMSGAGKHLTHKTELMKDFFLNICDCINHLLNWYKSKEHFSF